MSKATHTGQAISTHAPRKGSDTNTISQQEGLHDFNPRPPQGERRAAETGGDLQLLHFNPRPPQGERPATARPGISRCHFNPRPPQGERQRVVSVLTTTADFNPRPPQGERPQHIAFRPSEVPYIGLLRCRPAMIAGWLPKNSRLWPGIRANFLRTCRRFSVRLGFAARRSVRPPDRTRLWRRCARRGCAIHRPGSNSGRCPCLGR